MQFSDLAIRTKIYAALGLIVGLGTIGACVVYWEVTSAAAELDRVLSAARGDARAAAAGAHIEGVLSTASWVLLFLATTGIVLGVAETLGVFVLGPAYREVIGLLLFLLVLLLRPQGLFGRAR